MSDIPALIREVLALHEQATPGPWLPRVAGDQIVEAVRSTATGGDVVTTDCGLYTSREDAFLIAHYRTAAPALAREVQRAITERDAARAEAAEWRSKYEEQRDNYSDDLKDAIAIIRTEATRLKADLVPVLEETQVILDGEPTGRDAIIQLHRIAMTFLGAKARMGGAP